MALMDNRAFLVAHIRNSFITSDDTGMCELILESDDAGDTYGRHDEHVQNKSSTYPTLTGEDVNGAAEADVDAELAHSMDILPDMDFAGHRRRSNTAQRLEKLKRDKHKQSKIKHIQWKDNNTVEMVDELGEYFLKKDVIEKPVKRQSRLSQLLEQSGKSNNHFAEYAKYNGRTTVGLPTKKIDIYLTMAQGSDKFYPMTVITQVNARISQLVGLICWQYTEEDRQPPLRPNSEAYALYIAEDDGEVDADFPALDNREPISKFGFGQLALAEREGAYLAQDDSPVVTVFMSNRGKTEIHVDSLNIPMRHLLDECLLRRQLKVNTGPRYILEKEKQAGVAIDLDQPLSAMKTLEFRMIREHSTRGDIIEEEPIPSSLSAMAESLSSHQYKSYIVSLQHKLRTNAEVQLGISGEKIEIDPVSGKGKLFKQKAMNHPVEDVANCQILEEKPSGKATFRLVYQSNHDMRHHDFECDTIKAREITQKVCNILEMRSSPVRKDYLAGYKGKRTNKKSL